MNGGSLLNGFAISYPRTAKTWRPDYSYLYAGLHEPADQRCEERRGRFNRPDQVYGAEVQQGMAGIISLDFDYPLSYYTRKKVTYELVTHECNKLEVGE